MTKYESLVANFIVGIFCFIGGMWEFWVKKDPVMGTVLFALLVIMTNTMKGSKNE